MREEEIRPEEIFKTYLSLSEKDRDTYFSKTRFYGISCPSCKNKKGKFQFSKGRFAFEECPVCGMLYVNPRPKPDIFEQFYTNSPAIRYWATHFYKKSENARRRLVIRPKARRIKEVIFRHVLPVPRDAAIIDIGAGYGMLCEEIQNVFRQTIEIIAVEPSPSLQKVCRQKGIKTIGKFFENVTVSDIKDKKIIAALSFELFEHLADPDRFLSHCTAILPPKALLIITTLNWNGFDLQVLREQSRAINPPAHINFFTPRSIRILLNRHGFDVLDVTTPGMLDVDIVSRQLQDVKCGFVQKMILEGDETKKQRIQTFLRKSGMSSHMMVVAKKREK